MNTWNKDSCHLAKFVNAKLKMLSPVKTEVKWEQDNIVGTGEVD